MKNRACICLSLLFLTGVVNLGVLLAQENRGTILGRVTDPTGAVVADSRVTAKNKATNVEQTTTTDASGYYTFSTLPIGAYEVRVEKEGFKSAVAGDVVFAVGQRARLDFTLQLGAVTEAINKAAQSVGAPPVAAPPPPPPMQGVV